MTCLVDVVQNHQKHHQQCLICKSNNPNLSPVPEVQMSRSYKSILIQLHLIKDGDQSVCTICGAEVL